MPTRMLSLMTTAATSISPPATSNSGQRVPTGAPVGSEESLIERLQLCLRHGAPRPPGEYTKTTAWAHVRRRPRVARRRLPSLWGSHQVHQPPLLGEE